MLYARWCRIAAMNPAGVALVEGAEGRSWTFGELAGVADAQPPAAVVERPAGRGVDFLLAVLRGWRDGRPVCPLDTGTSLDLPLAVPPKIAHLKHTSASTGAPRLVGFTAAQLAADADQIVAMMGLRADWPNLGVISLAHSYGFSNLILPLLLHGIPLILSESPLPEVLRRAAAGWSALTVAAVPALWRTWSEAGAIPSTIRLAISAGAPLPLVLEKEIFAKYRLKIHNFYGSTECGGIAFDPTAVPRRDESWVGMPMPGLELKLAGDGCLEVRGKSVGFGYFPPDPAHLGRGRYRTRDVAEVRADGVYLRGRATDLMNVAGRKVAPEAVESVLLGHPGVRACVVFGTPDDEAARHERVVAVVAGDRAVLEASLRAYAQERLPAWQVPREWRWVRDIPTNVRGKVSRAVWRRRFLSGELEPASRD